MGKSLRVIPPLIGKPSGTAELNAKCLIEQINTNVMNAHDNLIKAKVEQAHQANKTRIAEPTFKVGEHVMLKTMNHRREYMTREKKKKEKLRVAKFMPRYDGPYTITGVNPERSSYTLDMPNSEVFNTFHVCQLTKWIPNNNDLYPQRQHKRPGPIVTPEGMEEYYIDKIINE